MKFNSSFQCLFAGCILTMLLSPIGNSAIAQSDRYSVVTEPVATDRLAPAHPPQIMAQASALSGSWRLLNMTEADLPTPMLPPAGSEPTVEFADGRIFGSGGCNRFNGGYEVNGNQLSIGPLASTFMACEEPIMTQETKYLTALQGAQRYEVNEPGQLTIFYETEQGSGVMRFAAESVRGMW